MGKQQSTSVTRSAMIIGGLALLGVLAVWQVTRSTPRAASDDTAAAEAATATRTQTMPAAAPPGEDASRRTGTGTPVTAQATTAATRGTAASRDTEPSAARDPALSARIGRTMTDVIQLLNADDFIGARAQLDELLQADVMAQMTPFEISRLYQMSFNVNMKEGSFAAAQSDLRAAIDSGGLNTEEVTRAEYQVAQLYVQQEDYAKAADSLEVWIAQPDAQPTKASLYLLAASYYYQEKYDDARDHMETALSMPGENQEAWYSMMAALYLQGEDYAKAQPVLEKMVELYDRDTYRAQLNAVNAELGE